MKQLHIADVLNSSVYCSTECVTVTVSFTFTTNFLSERNCIYLNGTCDPRTRAQHEVGKKKIGILLDFIKC